MTPQVDEPGAGGRTSVDATHTAGDRLSTSTPSDRDPLAITDEVARFASVASHDLRNGLATLSGFLELLEEDEPLSEMGAHLLERTLAVIGRMHVTVDAIGAYGRARRDRLEPTTLETDLVVDTAWDDLAELVAERGASIDIDQLPVVRADRDALRKVLCNVLDNAVRYHPGPSAPRVTVSGERDGPRCTVRIDDDGPGLPEGTGDEVLEPFSKTLNSSGHQRPGLGLATARVLVERMDGRIDIASREGGGTRVTIDLPAG